MSNFVNFKCLESLLIEGEELKIANENTTLPTVNINFFNKDFSKILIHNDTGIKTPEMNKRVVNAVNSFLTKSKSISSRIEKKFCDLCRKSYNEDRNYFTKLGMSDCSSYADFPTLTIKSITAQLEKYKDDSSNIIVVLQGEYTLDPEHGFSIGFINGKFLNTIQEFMGYWEK